MTGIAYVRDGTVWRTIDGRSWTEQDPQGFRPSEGAEFTILPDALATTTSDGLWETNDGIDRVLAMDGLPDATHQRDGETRQPHPERLRSGWFASDGNKGGSRDGDELWWYVGGTWVSLAEMGMEQPEELAWVGKAAVGSTTLFAGVGCATNRPPYSVDDLWVLTLDPAM